MALTTVVSVYIRIVGVVSGSAESGVYPIIYSLPSPLRRELYNI